MTTPVQNDHLRPKPLMSVIPSKMNLVTRGSGFKIRIESHCRYNRQIFVSKAIGKLLQDSSTESRLAVL